MTHINNVQPAHWLTDNSVHHAIWKLVQVDEDRVAEIQKTNNLPEALAVCLANLNLTPGEDVKHFLSPDWDDLYDPFLMLGMERALQRLNLAIANHEPIRVVTDYDVDGTMSSLILQSTLRIMGHNNLSYHIPDRKLEGYGLTEIAVRKAISDGIHLIVTADIGVRDINPIKIAKQNGVDVIVLDHHLPKGCGVPEDAYAVLCPPQPDCPYPNKALAACGISLKFAQAALKSHPHYAAIIRSLTKLAALGTVADVVSLREPENRAIVSIGLDALNKDPMKPGLEALLRVAAAPQGTITSDTVGYKIGPRINAAGRMASALHVISLMLAKNSVEAQTLALQLDSLNTTRKEIQDEMVRVATEVTENASDPFIFIVNDEAEMWHSGICGIVAGRIRELRHRPVAIATRCGNTITGSIRSTDSVHAVKALDSVSQYLIKYGGHAAAAGFSFDAQCLPQIREGLSQNVIEQLGRPYETPTYLVNFKFNADEINFDLLSTFLQLEPCGTANTQPVICISNVQLQDITWMKDIHFSASFKQNDRTIRAIWFSAPDQLRTLTKQNVDVMGSFKREFWNGKERFTMMIEDMRPAQ